MENNSLQLQLLIASTDTPQNWEYEKILQLPTSLVREASYDMIMDNADDVAHGVNRVQVVYNKRYFEIFNSLIIKHHIDGSIQLVFNDIVVYYGDVDHPISGQIDPGVS